MATQEHSACTPLRPEEKPNKVHIPAPFPIGALDFELEAAVAEAGARPERAAELAADLGLSYADANHTAEAAHDGEPAADDEEEEGEETTDEQRADFAGAILDMLRAESEEDANEAILPAINVVLAAAGGSLNKGFLVAILECARAAAEKALLYGEISGAMDAMTEQGKLVRDSEGRYGKPEWVIPDPTKEDVQKTTELVHLLRTKIHLGAVDDDALTSRSYWTQAQVDQAREIVRTQGGEQ